MSETDPLILVIEDELPIQRFLRATLANHAYRMNRSDHRPGWADSGSHAPARPDYS